MSYVLSQKEAQDIVAKMCEAYGFNVCECRLVLNEYSNRQYQICNVYSNTKISGFLWWKKTKQIKQYEIVNQGDSWEDVIEKFDLHLQGPAGQGRVDKADEIRKKYASLLLDEELRKE